MALAYSSRNPGVPFSQEIKDRLAASAGQTNEYDIYCPLAGCRCLILRKGHAQLVNRKADVLQHPSARPAAHQKEDFKTVESIQGTTPCWLVTSPMSFENIGFTKGVLSSTAAEDDSEKASYIIPEGSSVRFLSCADCDCGPLGWHIESKGSDLGRDVEEQVNTQLAGYQTTKGNAPVREFLIPIERCRYKLDA